MKEKIEKIEKMAFLPLVIVFVAAIIFLIVLGVVKAQTSKETNVDTNTSEIVNEEENETIETEIIDEEIVEENEKEEEVKENEEKEADAQPKYFIRVNYGQNVVTIYTQDSNGEYTVPYKAMVCSTGKATPRSGTYTMPSSGSKLPRGTWGLMVGNVWAQYFTRITGSILFHSVPYTERNKWSLEYWEYDKLGTTASAGCVRLTVENAKWIYNNCPAGTKVEFYTDSNPGPLGKPTAQKISEDEAVRGWDPTDPDANNPWKTYIPEPKEEEIEQPEENNNPTTNPETEPSTPVIPEENNPEEEIPGEDSSNTDEDTPGEDSTNSDEEIPEGDKDNQEEELPGEDKDNLEEEQPEKDNQEELPVEDNNNSEEELPENNSEDEISAENDNNLDENERNT